MDSTTRRLIVAALMALAFVGGAVFVAATGPQEQAPCEHRAAPPYAEATVTVHEAVRSGAPEGTFEWTGPRYYATTEDGRRLVLGFEPQPGDTLRIGVRTTERVWLRQGRELLVLDR